MSVTRLFSRALGPSMYVGLGVGRDILICECFLPFCRVDSVVPLEGVCCEPGVHSILSYSSRLIKLWYIVQLYEQSTNIGARCTFLQTTSHPLVPLRVVAACADSAVRVVSPITASVLTTALLPLERKVTSVCYCSLAGNLKYSSLN